MPKMEPMGFRSAAQFAINCLKSSDVNITQTHQIDRLIVTKRVLFNGFFTNFAFGIVKVHTSRFKKMMKDIHELCA
jgi:hypothetical protein